MPGLIFLLFAILALSGAIIYWLRDTAMAGTGLSYVYAIVTSLVISSVLYDISLIISMPYRAFLPALALAGILALYYQWRQHSFERLSLKIPQVGAYSLLVLALLYYLSSLFLTYSVRWGRTDARAIWTLHALFLTHEQHWANMFTNTIAWSHPDYPLLLSSWIAMVWRAIGTADAVVPCMVSYLVFITVLVTICMALKGNNRYFLNIMGLLAFAFNRHYAEMPAFQGADTLLSLLILMAFILARQNGKSIKLFLLTGFITGFAGWAKNEGIAFIVVFSLGMIWAHRRSPVQVIYFIAGLALPLLIIIIYKTIYAPPNDIVSGQDHGLISRLTDINRYKLTALFFFHNIRDLYCVLLVLTGLIVIKGYRRLFDMQLLMIIMMVVVYFFVFIITPRDLQWHLETASIRLFLQLFPAFVYVLGDLLVKEGPLHENI